MPIRTPFDKAGLLTSLGWLSNQNRTGMDDLWKFSLSSFFEKFDLSPFDVTINYFKNMIALYNIKRTIWKSTDLLHVGWATSIVKVRDLTSPKVNDFELSVYVLYMCMFHLCMVYYYIWFNETIKGNFDVSLECNRSLY